MTLLGAGRVRELLRRHNVRLTKSLGQNFVVDPNTIRKVADAAAVEPTDHVLEIGAGAGSLTLELAQRANVVTALEVDERLRPILADTLGDVSNVRILFADVLDFDLESLDATKVVANLPYNIAAQTVIKILQEAPRIRSLSVMTQREVGERIVAAPGSKTYGLTSVLVAFYGTARMAGRISRNVFFPPPTVDSVLIQIDRRASIDHDAEDAFVRICRAAFGQRRKTIKRSLATVAPADRLDVALARSRIEPGARPETLAVDDFVRLVRALA